MGGLPLIPQGDPSEMVLVAFLSTALSTLSSVIRIALGAFPLVYEEGLRERTGIRVLVVLLGYLALTGLYALMMLRLQSVAFYLTTLVTFSLIMVGVVAAIHYLFDVRWLVAVFAGTAGYTVQNLASGVDEVASVLATGHGILGFSDARYFVCYLVVSALVYVPYWMLFVRAVRRAGVSLVRDRSIVVLMFLAMAVVIGFDLIIKNLTDWYAIGVGMVLPLRIIHGLACVFVLWLLYVLLVRSSLQVDVAVQRRITEERDRAYELSRKSIEVVNARLHDIRHSVLHLLDEADPNLDRSTLAEVSRQISVYDSRVHTGNDALDTVLSEKSLSCSQQGITLTCVADGHALSFMPAGETYTLFEELLDSAVDTGTTSVSLTVRQSKGVVSIHVECDGKGGSPVVPPDAFRIAVRHGGSVTVIGRCVDVVLMDGE